MNLPSLQSNPNLIFLDQMQIIECAKRLEGSDNFDQLFDLKKKTIQVGTAIIITLASTTSFPISFSATTSFLTIAAIFTISNFILKAMIDYVENAHHSLESSTAAIIIHNYFGVYPSQGISARVYNYSFNRG